MENHSSCSPKQLVYLILFFTICFSACAPNQIIANKVKKEFKNSTIIQQYQVGFALYDKEKKEMIFQKDADKYYTPASNTKLYTFYAGLKMMPDLSLPSNILKKEIR